MPIDPISALIVDDEPAICSGCRLALSGRCHSVDICMTGKAGLDAVLGGSYDIVLLDMKLPDMDGMEILRTARRERPGIYIVVMTGYSTVHSAVEAMKLGAFDYLTKPFTDDELVLTVEKAIEKKRLAEENLSLQREHPDRFSFRKIVGENPQILRIFDQIKKVAPTDSTVLICGESGTGKELVARSIHAHSQRATRQFIAVDCSTFSPGLFESELFGHVKGAFTGAIQDRAGIFEVADRGTLFMDDVANLPVDIQAKLLRVLETHEYKPVGSSHPKKADVRAIAATNKDLKAMVDEGKFREDLFYRLNIFPISLPPLRERRDDIPKLAYHFLRDFCRKTGKRIDGFSDSALETLVAYEWPGNVRELKNVIERLVIMSDTRTLELLNLSEHLQIKRFLKTESIPETVEELKAIRKHLFEEGFGQIQEAFLIKALKACNGNITRAAKKVGMQRPNFIALMRKYHVSTKSIKQNM